MTFSEYLNILYPFFDWEQVQRKIAEKAEALNEDDTETEPIFTSNRKSKAKFTKALLISGLKNGTACRKEFLKWTDDYYLKLFRGDEGRSASSVLSRINLETDFDDLAFRDYISEYFEKRFDEIRAKFDKIDIPIAEGDEAERLLEIFKNICAEFSEKNDLKIKLLHDDQSQIAGIIKRLTKILDRMFAIAITADLSQLDHSTELVDFLRSASVNYLSSASREKFATYNESHVLQFHPCELASWRVNRAKSKASDNKASDSRDIPNTAKAIENDVTIDQVFQCSKEVIDKNMPEWLKAIAQNLEELMSENQKLSLFCTLYPQYDALTKLYQKAFTLRPKMFCRDWASDIEKPYSKDVYEYIELLKSCFQSIV